jgi:hypothetical protein
MSENKVYIGYADADIKWLQRLRATLLGLQRRGVEVWDRSQTPAGRFWREELQRAISSARVAIILLSSDYLASPFNTGEELPALLKARRRGTVLIPVLVRPCVYESIPEIAALVPLDARPLSVGDTSSAEEAFVQLARQIAETLVSAPLNSAQSATSDVGSESTASVRPIPTRGSLRQLMNAVLISDSDLDAFCLDHFRDIYQRIAPTMDRGAKINLLLHHKDPGDVLERLRQDAPSATQRHESLLVFTKDGERRAP